MRTNLIRGNWVLKITIEPVAGQSVVPSSEVVIS